jgi:predicted phosphodiesterase
VKIAFFSDIHGNYRALEAVLDDIEKQHPDVVICGGDIPNPLFRSKETWLKIKSLGIPIIRGNHEDYIVRYFYEPNSEVARSAQFQPIQLVAEHLGREIADEFAKLPLTHRVPGPPVGLGEPPGSSDVFVCHASPKINHRSYLHWMDSDMAEELRRTGAQTIISGHVHLPRDYDWEGRLLVTAGSVGIPFGGKPRAEYTILTDSEGMSKGSAKWKVEHRYVPYDFEGTLKEFGESGMLAKGGPIAWLLYDEILCQDQRLGKLFIWMRERGISRPMESSAWEKIVKTFLESLGRWEPLKTILFKYDVKL